MYRLKTFSKYWCIVFISGLLRSSRATVLVCRRHQILARCTCYCVESCFMLYGQKYVDNADVNLCSQVPKSGGRCERVEAVGRRSFSVSQEILSRQRSTNSSLSWRLFTSAGSFLHFVVVIFDALIAACHKSWGLWQMMSLIWFLVSVWRQRVSDVPSQLL